MPQTVKITVNINILPSTPPPPPPLVVTPDTVTLPDATVGVDVGTLPVAVVSGGTPPFSQPIIDPASPAALPPGLTASIDASGAVTITGTPTTPGSGTVILDVSDSSS